MPWLYACRHAHIHTITPAPAPATNPSTAACAAPTANASALAVAGRGSAVFGAGGDWYFCAGPTNYGVYFDGRLGRSAQFTAPARMAVVSPAVWHYVAQLGPWRLRQSTREMECYCLDGSVRCHLVFCHTPPMDSRASQRLHGRRAVLVVAAPRAYLRLKYSNFSTTLVFVYII